MSQIAFVKDENEKVYWSGMVYKKPLRIRTIQLKCMTPECTKPVSIKLDRKTWTVYFYHEYEYYPCPFPSRGNGAKKLCMFERFNKQQLLRVNAMKYVQNVYFAHRICTDCGVATQKTPIFKEFTLFFNNYVLFVRSKKYNVAVKCHILNDLAYYNKDVPREFTAGIEKLILFSPFSLEREMVPSKTEFYVEPLLIPSKPDLCNSHDINPTLFYGTTVITHQCKICSCYFKSFYLDDKLLMPTKSKIRDLLGTYVCWKDEMSVFIITKKKKLNKRAYGTLRSEFGCLRVFHTQQTTLEYHQSPKFLHPEFVKDQKCDKCNVEREKEVWLCSKCRNHVSECCCVIDNSQYTFYKNRTLIQEDTVNKDLVTHEDFCICANCEMYDCVEDMLYGTSQQHYTSYTKTELIYLCEACVMQCQSCTELVCVNQPKGTCFKCIELKREQLSTSAYRETVQGSKLTITGEVNIG